MRIYYSFCGFFGFFKIHWGSWKARYFINKQYLIYWDKIRLRVGDDSPQLNLIGYCDCKSLSLVWLTTFVKLVFIFFFLFFLFKKKSVVKLRIFFLFLRNCIVRTGDWRFQSWIFQLKKPKCVHLNYNFTRICNLICYVFTCIFIVSLGCFFHTILSQDFNSFFTFYCWNFDTWIEFFFFFTQLYHTMRLLFFYLEL